MSGSPEQNFFPQDVRQTASAELAHVFAAQEQGKGPELITSIDGVFKAHNVPVRAFETARVADIDGVSREFSMRRDDLVHHAAISDLAQYDPEKVVLPVIVGDPAQSTNMEQA